MLTIITSPKQVSIVQKIIQSIDRLDELVSIDSSGSKPSYDHKIIYVEGAIIKIGFDWNDLEPAYIFPEIPFSENNLLALVFLKIGNFQKSLEFIDSDHFLYQHILIFVSLITGETIYEHQLIHASNYFSHNKAIVGHYGNCAYQKSKEEIIEYYETALSEASESKGDRLFTCKHFINYLIDNDLHAYAEKLLRQYQPKAYNDDSANAFRVQQLALMKSAIKPPYEEGKLSEILALLEESIKYSEARNLLANAGMLYMDASEIANLKTDFVLATNYVNKAIICFKKEEIPYFLAEAQLQKAVIQYTWSKHGSPQYYKYAITHFQEALKFFTKENYPQKFAYIHHHIALIYSEMPVLDREKSFWVAFCVSSFEAALAFYTEDNYTYEYAMVCHNYATALMSFPKNKSQRNYLKAFDLFEDALKIRTEHDYPLERVLTLLNQLELYWLRYHEKEVDEEKSYEEMLLKANSIYKLTKDKFLVKKADKHIKELKKIKEYFEEKKCMKFQS